MSDSALWGIVICGGKYMGVGWVRAVLRLAAHCCIVCINWDGWGWQSIASIYSLKSRGVNGTIAVVSDS